VIVDIAIKALSPAINDRTAQNLYAFPEDLALARVADTQGLGGSSDP